MLIEGQPSVLDPILLGYIEGFEAGVEVVKMSAGDGHRQAAMKLCELARDIRFRLGPPDESPPELTERIVQLFRSAVDCIEPHGDPLVDAFRTHIRERADILSDTVVHG